MRFKETPLHGVWILDSDRMEDDRGYLARIYCINELAKHDLESKLVQMNISYNREVGTLRGMHYQNYPRQEVKLVRCIRGKVFDVAVDLRPTSNTYLQWFGVELSAENQTALYIPKGCAHGFESLEPNSELVYCMSEFYTPKFGCGFRWNDPIIGIRWPIIPVILSEKDKNWPDLEVLK